MPPTADATARQRSILDEAVRGRGQRPDVRVWSAVTADPSAAPLVTVVMAVRNGAGTIGAAVESVLGQTMTDHELLVVDDRSDDDTLDILRGFGADPRLRVHASPDHLGTARARNLAMGLARGTFIAIADADDVSLPERLALQTARFSARPELVAVGGQMVEFGDWGRREHSYRWPETTNEIRRTFERGRMGIAHAGSMFRKDAALAVGGYDTGCARSEDLALFRKLASAAMEAVPDDVVEYRVPQSIGLKYVWREQYYSVLAEQRNPLGAAESSGSPRLPPVGFAKAVAWTVRSYGIRRAREVGSFAQGARSRS